MQSMLRGVPSNLIRGARGALAAVLVADTNQEHESVCVMLGREDDPNHALISFTLGDDLAWATGCWQYASRKLEYLVNNPEATTSFEGAKPEEGLYGGGVRIAGILMAVSGLTSEADLVTGLLILIHADEINTDQAREVVRGVSETCTSLFDRALSNIHN